MEARSVRTLSKTAQHAYDIAFDYAREMCALGRSLPVYCNLRACDIAKSHRRELREYDERDGVPYYEHRSLLAEFVEECGGNAARVLGALDAAVRVPLRNDLDRLA